MSLLNSKLKLLTNNRSSHPVVFCKKGVLKNFTKFIGKQLCQSLFLSKVASLRSATLLKKSFWHKCFPVNFVKFLITPISLNKYSKGYSCRQKNVKSDEKATLSASLKI